MNLDLDVIAAVICGAISLALFFIHVITSPRHAQWVTPPETVRVGLLLSGFLFMWRSINFLTLSPAELRGHANAEAILTGGALLYLLIVGGAWASEIIHQKHLAELSRERELTTSR